MREMVSERIDRLYAGHANLKKKKYGFLIRPTTLIVGWIVVIVGLITIPLPGQGWLTTFIGVGILSFETDWAKKFLEWGVRQYDNFFAWYRTKPVGFRAFLVILLILLIWVIFAIIFWLMWKYNAMNWAEPWATQFFTWVGLEK